MRLSIGWKYKSIINPLLHKILTPKYSTIINKCCHMHFTQDLNSFTNKSVLEHGIESLGFILRSIQLFALIVKANGDLFTTHGVVLRHVSKGSP